VCHALLEDPKFFWLLKRIDEELAARVRAEGCVHCGAVLHRADYPRKPRGGAAAVRADQGLRFSFCCQRCRKRHTSGSVRFLGRRVYFGLAVVLLSARHAGQTAAAARLGEMLAVPMRTLERWRRWWQERFAQTRLWQAQGARFMPPVSAEALPGELLERFRGETTAGVLHLLSFLTSLSIGVVFDVGAGC